MHKSRISGFSIDCQTDDIEAEAKRLEALGVTRVAAIRDWLVMEAPTGQRFCLAPPSRSKFDEEANVWP